MTSLEEAHRRCWPQVLATTVRLTRDLDLAEECVQDAYVRALTAWGSDPPRNPGAWLTATARRIAIDCLRRESTLRAKLPLLVMEDDADDPGSETDLLRLVFTCCHPALSRDAQIVLTLRLLGGLTVVEIASGLLIKEATVAARITRAKRKIAAAAIPFRVPVGAELDERLDAVLEVVYLIHTAGHTAVAGPDLMRPDLCAKARALAGLLADLMPDCSEAHGLLALCLLTGARAGSRSGPDGQLLLLADQDRRAWDHRLVDAGLLAATRALRTGTGRYALQAAIAGLHARAPDLGHTDWAAIVTMYDGLLASWPTPVVALNRIVALSMVPGADLVAILDEVDLLGMDPSLERYPYLPAVRADLLRRLGHNAAAAHVYAKAIALTRNTAESDYLSRRLHEVRGAGNEDGE